MPFRFPPRSIYRGGIIDAFSFDTLPADNERPNNPASVRFRSIAEITLRGIQRCVASDRELQGESEQTSSPDETVLGNLGDSLLERLAFVSNKALSVSDVSKTLGFGDAQDTQNGGNS